LTKQIDCDVFKLTWIDLSTIEIKKYKNQEIYLRYTTLLKDFRYKDNSNEDHNRMGGWYFFINRSLGSIDYIGVSGTIKGKLTNYNDLYHRISQHFGTSTGATFCRNYYRGDTIPNREKWINTLKQNYDLWSYMPKKAMLAKTSYMLLNHSLSVFFNRSSITNNDFELSIQESCIYSINDESYKSHSVHAYVKTVNDLYHDVGRSQVTFVTLGLKGVIDLDRLIFESLAETTDTISHTLYKCTVNDT
jgi:hypothetical protein